MWRNQKMGCIGLLRVPRKPAFGFGSQSAEMPFSQAVTDSLKSAATAAGVDLVILDNRYDASTALKNADEFVRKRVDLVIEFRLISEWRQCSPIKLMMPGFH